MPLPDTLSVACRAAAFVLLLQASGTVIFELTFRRLLPSAQRARLLRIGRGLALGALLFVTAQFALEAARMAGEMSGATDVSLQMLALTSRTGTAFILRLLGLAGIVIAMGGASWNRLRQTCALCAAALCIGSFAVTGHTSESPHRALTMTLLLVHLVVVAFWIGALRPLISAVEQGPPAVAGRLICAFSAVAGWLVPLIALAGIGLAVVLLPGLAALAQPYGLLLLLKVGLFGVLMGLAAINKWRYGPAIAGASPAAAARFIAMVWSEYALIATVLAATAVLTTFFSPEGP